MIFSRFSEISFSKPFTSSFSNISVSLDFVISLSLVSLTDSAPSLTLSTSISSIGGSTTSSTASADLTLVTSVFWVRDSSASSSSKFIVSDFAVLIGSIMFSFERIGKFSGSWPASTTSILAPYSFSFVFILSSNFTLKLKSSNVKKIYITSFYLKQV